MRQQEGMPHGDVMLRRIEIVSEYKFAISFENTDQEVDYVTEKVWMTWASGTVPIYWGTPNIDEWLPGTRRYSTQTRSWTLHAICNKYLTLCS